MTTCQSNWTPNDWSRWSRWSRRRLGCVLYIGSLHYSLSLVTRQSAFQSDFLCASLSICLSVSLSHSLFASLNLATELRPTCYNQWESRPSSTPLSSVCLDWNFWNKQRGVAKSVNKKGTRFFLDDGTLRSLCRVVDCIVEIKLCNLRRVN